MNEVAAWVEQLLARQFDYREGAAMLDIEGRGDMGARKFANWAEYLEDKGRQSAADRIRTSLQTLLVKRFGAIPPSMIAALEQASVDQLGQWVEQALDAPSVEALLAGTTAS